MPRPGEGILAGFRMSLDSDGQTVRFSNGFAFVPGLFQRIWSGSELSVKVTTAISQWRHFYVTADSSGNPTVEANSTAPDVPYQGTGRTLPSDQTRRYLGSIYFGSDGTALPFMHNQWGMQGNRIDFTLPTGILDSRFALITAGISQSTPVIISAATLVPSTCRILHAQVFNSAALNCFLSNPELGTLSRTNYQRRIMPNNGPELEVVLDSQQRFNYIYDAGVTLGGSLEVRGIGYVFDR